MLTRSPNTVDEVLTSRALQAFPGEHSTAMAGQCDHVGVQYDTGLRRAAPCCKCLTLLNHGDLVACRHPLGGIVLGGIVHSP